MRAFRMLHPLIAVHVASTFLVLSSEPARGQPQSRFMPPPAAPTLSLGLQTRVTDTGVLITGHAPNSVGKAAGFERGDTIITVDGQQVGQVVNRLVDLDQTLQSAINRQGSAVILIRNGRDGRLVNVGLRRDQFSATVPVMPGPARPKPPTPPPGGGLPGQIIQVKKWYLEYLGREATPQEVGGWEAKLRQGFAMDAIKNDLLASPEYYRRNGNDEAKFIGALFRDLVRRNPVHPEGSNWLTRLKQLKGDRARFIEAFRSHYRV
jgi:hypothetical protein